jgi:predicted nucleic acid-binding protein
MKMYADTSVLIAWFHPADQFAQQVTKWCREREVEFCWNPLLRTEVRHKHARAFLTCDVAQAELARLARLPQVQLFR